MSTLQVTAVAWTTFQPPPDLAWTTDAEGADALAEFAGRACYDSWDRPNPATATNASYLRHILEVGHLAVAEHASVTLYLRNVSRSLTHELVRHRHFSYSQLSQRHAPHEVAELIEPAAVAADPQLHARFVEAGEHALAAYRDILAGLEHRAGEDIGPLARKQARQAAQAVLPTAVGTRIVVTGNLRAWRHFIAMRASEHADIELRGLAVAVLRELRKIAPNLVGDFEITELPDGTQVASSPLATEG